jgi:hypothetical protein
MFAFLTDPCLVNTSDKLPLSKEGGGIYERSLSPHHMILKLLA